VATLPTVRNSNFGLQAGHRCIIWIVILNINPLNALIEKILCSDCVLTQNDEDFI